MIEVKFKNKPIPVPLIYQPVYKIVMLLAILKYGTKKQKVSLLTLNIYFWSIRSEKNHKILLDISKKSRDSIIPWSFEPGLEKTINLAIVGKYCTRFINNGTFEIKLELAGEKLLHEVEKLQIFNGDITKIKSIGAIPASRLQKSATNWNLN